MPDWDVFSGNLALRSQKRKRTPANRQQCMDSPQPEPRRRARHRGFGEVLLLEGPHPLTTEPRKPSTKIRRGHTPGDVVRSHRGRRLVDLDRHGVRAPNHPPSVRARTRGTRGNGPAQRETQATQEWGDARMGDGGLDGEMEFVAVDSRLLWSCGRMRQNACDSTAYY